MRECGSQQQVLHETNRHERPGEIMIVGPRKRYLFKSDAVWCLVNGMSDPSTQRYAVASMEGSELSTASLRPDWRSCEGSSE